MKRVLLDMLNCPNTAEDLIHDVKSICNGKDLSKVEARLTFGYEGPCLAFYVIRPDEDDSDEEARARAEYERLKARFG